MFYYFINRFILTHHLVINTISTINPSYIFDLYNLYYFETKVIDGVKITTFTSLTNILGRSTFRAL